MKSVFTVPSVALAMIILAGLATTAPAQELPALKKVAPAPVQPIPFPHQTHIKNGLECRQCHPMPDPGDFMEIVGTEFCMNCHIAIKTDSPAIQKLTKFHTDKSRIEWEPVYLIPQYVFFSHKVHTVEENIKCEACHGPVGERLVLAKEKDTSMAGCMDCHRAAGASLACNFCHEPR